jgi:hypothetical protein
VLQVIRTRRLRGTDECFPRLDHSTTGERGGGAFVSCTGDYLRFNAELASPTGRIDFGQVASSLAKAKSAVACAYYNRSDAILLNRVLLAGLRLAGWLSTDSQLTARVFRLAQIPGASVPTMGLTQMDLDNARRVIDRRRTAYSSALTLIDLLVNDSSPHSQAWCSCFCAKDFKVTLRTTSVELIGSTASC